MKLAMSFEILKLLNCFALGGTPKNLSVSNPYTPKEYKHNAAKGPSFRDACNPYTLCHQPISRGYRQQHH